ncbi:MAG: aminotransferase class I/II-fold pyridoxal phosphate-dependent enzyme [Planctomycetes bacterium]|nr:aminotransferase class I/II-fold pyridoxal phosphate-dependent enzyme [Planctomycetota bacterium]
MHIADRMKNIKASGIRRVFDLAASLPDPVNLSIGQPHFDVPEAAREAAVKAIRDGRNNYTPSPGIPELREAVSQWFSRRNVLHDTVIVSPGASGPLTLSIMALAGPGDEVLVPDPYFVSYKQLVTAAGATPVYYNTYPDFIPRPDVIEPLVTPRTRAILLNSPNNPTGALYPEQAVRDIAAIAAAHGVTIISDEVYDCFAFDAPPFSPGSVYPDTVTINALSKSASMTGWRIGFAVGPSEIINEMIKLQQFTYVCAPQPMQWAALTVLNADTSDRNAEYAAKRDRVVNGLGPSFRLSPPGGAFYAFPQVPVEGLSGTDFCMKAVENNLLVIPGSVFSELDTHFRISFAAEDETIDKGVAILNNLALSLAAGNS